MIDYQETYHEASMVRDRQAESEEIKYGDEEMKESFGCLRFQKLCSSGPYTEIDS